MDRLAKRGVGSLTTSGGGVAGSRRPGLQRLGAIEQCLLGPLGLARGRHRASGDGEAMATQAAIPLSDDEAPGSAARKTREECGDERSTERSDRTQRPNAAMDER